MLETAVRDGLRFEVVRITSRMLLVVSLMRR